MLLLKTKAFNINLGHVLSPVFLGKSLFESSYFQKIFDCGENSVVPCVTTFFLISLLVFMSCVKSVDWWMIVEENAALWCL